MIDLIEIDQDKCFNCGACASACPLGLIEVRDRNITVNEGCTDCGLCANTCPVGAIEIGEDERNSSGDEEGWMKKWW